MHVVCRVVYEVGACLEEVRGRVYLGREVGEVGLAGAPDDAVLALMDAVAHPVVAHVHGLGAALLGVVVDEVHGDHVVDFAEGGVLWEAEVVERVADGDAGFAVGVCCSEFSLAGGAGDDIESHK